MSEDIARTHEGEDYARVCVGCLHLEEGRQRLLKGGKECFASKTELGTRLRSRYVGAKSENVQVIMSGLSLDSQRWIGKERG